MTIPVLSLVFLSFILCSLLCFGALQFFPKLGLMDRPERYGHKRAAIPYPGGVALVLTVLGLGLVFLPISEQVLWIFGGALLLALTSFIDDRRGLSPYLRFVIQIIAALALVKAGVQVFSLTNPFGGSAFELTNLHPFLNFSNLLILIWVVAMVNAFNWLDGVPGMTSSIGAVSAGILLLLAVRPDFHLVDQTFSVVLAALLFGSCLAFFCFDFPPPRLLMGDTGSMFLGYLIAVTAIISGGKIATTILVLGFPLLDFAWVILRRLMKGQSPFKGDLWHFHHRFLYAGFSNKQVVLLYAGLALLFGLLALNMQTLGKVWTFLVIFLIMALLAVYLYARSRSRNQTKTRD